MTGIRYNGEREHDRSARCVPPSKTKKESVSLARQLQAKIKAMGPITVAEYMKEVLTNPVSGYYMHRDVIGETGDFITSPELGQLFGEMVAVWCFNEWQKMGSPIPLQLVEMGPGRGSLAEDVLRVFERFGAGNEVSLHLVEVSPRLSQIQAQKLCVKTVRPSKSSHTYYQLGTTATNIPVFWYNSIQDVPRQFSCYLAHEFFDALPIHKFQRTEAGWREVLIDIDPAAGSEKFRYVLSRTSTPASKTLIKADEKRDHVEVCAESGVILEHLATRLEEDGGFALFADYGHDGSKTDTFRGFRNHELHDALVDPGSADLTADVDFSYIRACTEDKLLTFGPVTQRHFLKQMGIDMRLQILLQNCGEKQKENLLLGYHMMVDEDKMGERFKLFSLFPSVLKDHLERFPVSGFADS
ncbi:protein arginine methyltransferase NDUFAF7, mitochondrial isoform X2 [Cryptotermes secundus]|uniref:protein arginine methyltransferase NDUFAF7, mitochondrial isoform X2 n=1 Tax=Cryptotermes secundus TaxID=105785 RepID=UPI000CD7D9B6|nr:protein arginine methyltransferase NDUFAF7, mitochondrial isoform X2 [Cryptotermes secundus]